LEREDIQGYIVSGYLHLPCATYVLLRVSDATAARAWLARLTTEITTAEGKQEGTSINVAFTRPGLERLGLSFPETLATFPLSFLEGMASPYRTKILGDDGENDPANWEWGGTEQKRADILLLLFGAEEGTLDALLARQRATFAAGGVVELRALGAGRQPDTHEHFGFNDNITEPALEGTSAVKDSLPDNVIKAGEVLLSYINDYDQPTDSPMISPAHDPHNLLPNAQPVQGAAPDAPVMRDLGRNGTYVVFRHLGQHVADFWNFLDEATRGDNGEINRQESVRLGAKFVGRWPSGAPLVKAPDADNPALSKDDDFKYLESDPHGFKCPVGSHIRRSNPRDSLPPNAKMSLASVNRHRLMRRGRSYGPRAKDPRVQDGIDRGLHFICLNADIERQFEFVQQTWINSPVFNGLCGEVDPLVGHLSKGDEVMTVQGDPVRQRVHNLRRFITVRGGAYFFMPGMKALRYLASL
jgi:Dyp-type peroxidase family